MTEVSERNLAGEIHALEEKLSLLRRQLFVAPDHDKQTAVVDLLRFRISDKVFALFLSDVVEVLRMVKYLPLPKAPPDIYGVINCRGMMIPLLNPGLLLSSQEVAPALTSNLIVIFAGGQHIALMVDGVEGVSVVPQSDLKLELDGQAAHQTLPKHFAGYMRSESGTTFILDVEQLLNLEDQKTLSHALMVRDEWGQG